MAALIRNFGIRAAGLRHPSSLQEKAKRIYQSLSDAVNGLDEHHVLIFLFLCSVIIRTFLYGFMKHASTYDDEWYYLQSAYDVAHGYGFGTIYGQPNSDPALMRMLYIACIAPACLIHDMQIRFLAIAFINSALLSVSIFPVHYLSRQLIKKKQLRILVLIFFVIMPYHNIAIAFMSDIALFPVATTIICISLDLINWPNMLPQKRISHIVMLGICLVLSILAKPTGAILVAPIIASLAAIIIPPFFRAIRYRHREKAASRRAVIGAISALALLVIGFFIIATHTSILSSFNILGKIHRMLRLETLGDESFPISMFYMALTTILALGIFPIVVPLSAIRLFNKHERFQLVQLFIILCLFIFMVASYTHVVGTPFDPFSNSSRPLLRYFNFLFMPILVFFISACERISTQRMGRKACMALIALAACIGACTVLFYRGNSIGSVTDCGLLFCWQPFAQDDHLLASIIFLICLSALTLACIYRTRWFLPLFLSIWLCLQVSNNVISYRNYYGGYYVKSGDSILDLRDYVYEHEDETFLLIDFKSVNPAMPSLAVRYGDTFLDSRNIERIRLNNFDYLYDGANQPLDLSRIPIGPHALTDIDYVIVSKELMSFPVGGCQHIDIGNNDWYDLYRLDSDDIIPYLSFQPSR